MNKGPTSREPIPWGDGVSIAATRHPFLQGFPLNHLSPNAIVVDWGCTRGAGAYGLAVGNGS